MKKIFLLLSLSILFIACGDDSSKSQPDPNPAPDPAPIETIFWNDVANSSTASLVSSFWNGSGRYFNYGSNGNQDWHYWPQAHALDVMVDNYVRTGESTYKNYFDLWLAGVKVKNGNTYKNEYYDDMEWIALAVLRAYKATNDEKYKTAALEIWEYIKVGWNNNAGGGITWKLGMENSKNACSNGPACILAARLYQEFGDEENKKWALKIYDWERSVLFDSATGAVWDNIDSQTGQIQKNWIFTYNQGTFIGSAIELYKIFNQQSYLADAIKAAAYTTGSLTNNSILKSEGTGDGGLFKGIFVRYLTEMVQQDGIDATSKKFYIKFLKDNATTLWNEGTAKPAIYFGADWRTKPGGSTGLTEQLSGCMLMEAVALLDKKGLL